MCQNREEQVGSRVKRVDRKASLNAYMRGYTESFVSCTKKTIWRNLPIKIM